MRKVVVISTNNNPDYMFYAPYQEKAWNKLGWELCIMVTHDVDPVDLKLPSYFQPNDKLSTSVIKLPEIDGLRLQTIAQAGRLYAANWFEDDTLLMTCDMDLLPLSDYWKPQPFDITVYGHDLTDYSYMPMGYVAMTAKNWRKYLECTGDTKADMLRDCKKVGIAYSPDWEQWWNTDWQILTDKLMPHKSIIKFVNRGRRSDAGFAFGRIDRGDSLKVIEKPWIDIHSENHNVKHPDKLNKFFAIYNEVYG